jgi:hypothetical protein
MKKSALYAIAATMSLSLFILLQASATELLYPVEIKNKPPKVRIYNVKIQQQQDQLVLSGLLKRRSYNSHVLPGHIDYVVIDTNENVIKQGWTQSPTGLNLRRYRYAHQFQLLLPNDLSEGSRIELSWHQDS